MSTKKTYQHFCDSNEVSLFFRPFWLDASDYEWDALQSEHEEHSAFWVFHFQKKLSLAFIRNPHLTPYSGIIFSDNSIHNKVKQILVTKLLQQLPDFDVLELDLSLLIPNELNFDLLEKSYKITNLLELKDRDNLYKNFKPALQRQIKKAEKNLTVCELDDIELFYKLHQKTFAKQNSVPKIGLSVYKNYWKISKENHCGKLLFIQDENENYHAALWLAYDTNTAYYLAGGTDPEFYGSGAMSKLMWHAIEISLQAGKKHFDFEGSMLPSVNRFFRNFSPVERSYVHLKKVNSTLYKLFKK